MLGASLLITGALVAGAVHEEPPAARQDKPVASEVAVNIDRFMARQWQADGVTPTELSDDATFLRRVTLDLVGRIPTYNEAVRFAAQYSPDKRIRAIAGLMQSPEHALHWGNVLDELIQEKYAGDDAFIAYLRRSVAAGKPWDQIFRELMLGPWDGKELEPASRFLAKRINSLDDLTNDTTRIFFGVEIGCAKCHDHPLVDDWKQDHFYGMESFFNRSYLDRKKKAIGEKDKGEVSFVDTAGQHHQAKLMFLSGKVIDVPDGAGRREQLVDVGLQDNHFFRRAIVNRIWAHLMGRGLVHPVDQMHSENPPSIDGLLEWLADDFAAHDYDLERLIGGIVSSRTYQLASVWRSTEDPPNEKYFAVSQLRPLSPQQFAISLLLATGEDAAAGDAVQPEQRYRKIEQRYRQLKQRYRQLDQKARSLTKWLDRPRDDYQASTTEALYLSNNPEVQQIVTGSALTARLAAISDTSEAVDTAFWTILSRPPDDEERSFLAGQLQTNKKDRAEAVANVIWALLTSAEFRFNH